MSGRKQEAIQLLKVHFPAHTDASLDVWAELLGMGMAISGLTISVVEKGRALDRLEKIERLARELWNEYTALPLSVRGKNEVYNHIFNLNYDLTGKIPVQRAAVQKHYPQKVGAVSQIKMEISDAMDLHHKQRDAEFIAKVSLMVFARDCWRGLAQKEAPTSFTEGSSFSRFVADLIVFSAKNWGSENCFRAWRTWERA